MEETKLIVKILKGSRSDQFFNLKNTKNLQKKKNNNEILIDSVHRLIQQYFD